MTPGNLIDDLLDAVLDEGEGLACAVLAGLGVSLAARRGGATAAAAS